jgi:hypothetical protein
MKNPLTMGAQSKKLLRAYRQYDQQRTELKQEKEVIEKRLNDLHPPSWIAILVEPFANEIAARLGCNYRIIGPYGIGLDSHVFFFKGKNEDNDVLLGHLHFTVSSIRKDGKLFLRDYRTDNGLYKPGSIGHDSKLHHPAIEVPPDATVDWFLDRIIEDKCG